jgi:galactokinase
MRFEGTAHGRVNLVGEHTDYNSGLVLPTLIPQRTVVGVEPRADRMITVRTDANGMAQVDVGVAITPRHDWSDHVVGVVDALRRRGQAIGGFAAEVRSSVPVGAGLSSSAALGVATARALRTAFDLALDDVELALVAHESEDRFVGAHVGLMDQLVCSVGRDGEALRIDLRDRLMRSIALDRVAMDIVVVDSSIRHEHATGDYNARRRECEDAARALGVRTLRDVGPETDTSVLPRVLARRVRHVLSENARVDAAVEAIERGDAAALGGIVSASHTSLRDDFEVSLPSIDDAVAAAQRDADVYGARIVGGGFGGSILVLARRGAASAVAGRIASRGSSWKVVLPAPV